MRYLLWLLACVCVACGAPVSKPSSSTSALTPGLESREPQSPLLPIYSDDLTWGASEPLVTIVAFLDFADAHSKAEYIELIELVEDNPELRLVVKQAPLRADAEPIAEATLAVRDTLGPEAAKEFLTMVSDAESLPSKDDLSAWALGLTASFASKAPRDPTLVPDVRRQLQQNLDLARRLELTYNPVVYVNGARWESADDDDERFSRLVAKELEASKASRKDSTSPEAHYARRVEENWESPLPPSSLSVRSPLEKDGPEPVWGLPTAPVTLVEFTDFQCPFCSRVKPTLVQLRKKYGPKQLRMVFKHKPLPFHKEARPAAEASVVVFRKGGANAFWRFHDLLFENQKDLTPENFERWAAEVGVEPTEFRRELERGDPGSKVTADLELAAKVGVSGTPAFRINGVIVSGAQPLDEFSAVIDEQLALAAELRKQGVAYGAVSRVLTERQLGQQQAPPTQPATPPSEDLTVWRVPVSPNDPVDGPNDALVTIIEFGNLQCPFCKRVQPTLQALRAKYGADLRIVWKDNPLPFHPRAKPAATVARSVYERHGAAAFWRVVAGIFESQPKLEDDDLKRVVQAQGRSWGHALAALKADRYASKFGESLDLASEFSARGTPHFFVNGVRLSGAQPQEKFEAVIDEQLKTARALLAAGTPRSKIFETIMASARSSPEPEKKQVVAPTSPAPFRGSAQAKVVIQMFSDFECPFCQRVNPTLDELLKTQPKGSVKLVWRNYPLPFHKDALLAAQAAHEVFEQLGNQGFWRYHKLLFEAQKQTDGLKRPNLEALAQQVGVNMSRFRSALDTEQHRARVESDKAAAEAAGISGTPGFVIGEYFLSGAQPLPVFEKLVRRAQATP